VFRSNEVSSMAHSFADHFSRVLRIVATDASAALLASAEVTSPAFAMTTDWRLPELLGYLRTWSATTRCREATGRDPVEALAPEVEALWGSMDRARRVTWPLALRVGGRP
jgi:hypothetical protein